VCDQCLREANAAFHISALLDSGVGIGVVFFKGCMRARSGADRDRASTSATWLPPCALRFERARSTIPFQ